MTRATAGSEESDPQVSWPVGQRTREWLRLTQEAERFIAKRSDNHLMIEILAMTAILVGMAFKGKGRNRFGRYIGGAIDHVLTMATLASNTLVGSLLTQTVTDTCRVSSIKCIYSLDNLTPTQNAGPIVCGVAHGDYTDAEVEAWLESTGSWAIADMVAAETQSRRCRIIGSFATPSAATQSVVLNDGKPIRTKLNWVLAEGQTLRVWAYNPGTAALATTVPNLKVNGKANLWVV